jgi:fructose-1,6-bisphosphatase
MNNRLATYEEVLRGWRYFWSQTEIDHFVKDENGRNLLDENGMMLAVRTKKQRQFPSKMYSYFKNCEQGKKKSDS